MKSAKDAPHSAINVTPLVDVCLVLLIIFMVVTPLLEPNAALQLPRAPSPDRLGDDRSRAVLSVHRDGPLWLGNRWLPESEMAAALAERHARNAAAPLLLYGDRELHFSDVRHAMRLAHAAGFPGVQLAARKEESGR